MRFYLLFFLLGCDKPAEAPAPVSVPDVVEAPAVEAPATEADDATEAPADDATEAPTEALTADATETPADDAALADDAPAGLIADGGACLSSTDCTSGICEGEGCDTDSPGVCAPQQRGCTRDLRPYCGCDGQTFRTSGSCPGRRYAHKGACPE